MDYYAIGQRVRKIRKAQNLSQEELAEKVNISTTHMSHIETGNTKLSLPVFAALATALEVPMDDLLYDNDTVNRSAAITDITEVLETCTTQQVKIISDIIKCLKMSLERNL